ncbi:MAG: HAMP domain-containing protein [Chloroflexota bacterium]
MNRLWVRFTLVISGILLSVIILPVLFGTRFVLRLEPTASDVYMADIRDALPTDLQVELHALIQQAVTTVLSRALIASALIGILAGIILSRMLLAPLQDLTTGARAIANRDLAHRVPVRGSDEMRMVAESFNDMAGQLEQG